MTPKEIIAVVSAFEEGKRIQVRRKYASSPPLEWLDCDVHPDEWNFAQYDYRVKPESFECWVALTRTGHVIGIDRDPKGLSALVDVTIHHMREVL